MSTTIFQGLYIHYSYFFHLFLFQNFNNSCLTQFSSLIVINHHMQSLYFVVACLLPIIPWEGYQFHVGRNLISFYHFYINAKFTVWNSWYLINIVLIHKGKLLEIIAISLSLVHDFQFNLNHYFRKSLE